jgi:hypothetical protein
VADVGEDFFVLFHSFSVSLLGFFFFFQLLVVFGHLFMATCNEKQSLI